MRLVVARRIRDSLREAIPYGYADDIHEALSHLEADPELGVVLNEQGDRATRFAWRGFLASTSSPVSTRCEKT